MPARPDAVPDRPVAVPARPDAAPNRPAAVPDRPDAEPVRPDTVPARPVHLDQLSAPRQDMPSQHPDRVQPGPREASVDDGALAPE